MFLNFMFVSICLRLLRGRVGIKAAVLQELRKISRGAP